MTSTVAEPGVERSVDHPGADSVGSRDRLIAAGLRAFTTRGFDGASLRDIERDAGVGRGLVAHHFGTKDRLWRACVDWLMGRFHDELVRVTEHLADVSPRERARVLLKVYVRFVARHPEYTRLLMLSGEDDESDRVQWMVETWVKPNLAFFDRLSGRPRPSAEHAAMSNYAFCGAASMLFALPAEAKAAFGIEVCGGAGADDSDLVEAFAEFLCQWVDYRSDGDGPVKGSSLDEAVAAGLAWQKAQVGRDAAG